LADPINESLRQSRAGPEPYDGVAENWFDSLEDLAPGMASPQGQEAIRELLEDERRFIDLARSPVCIARQHRVKV